MEQNEWNYRRQVAVQAADDFRRRWLWQRAGWPRRRAYRAADQCADFVAFFDPRCDGADFGYGHLVCSTVFFAMTAGYVTTLAVVLILAVCAIYVLCRGQRSR